MKYKRNNSRFSVKGRGKYMTKSDFILYYYCDLGHCREFFYTMKWPIGYYCEKCGCTIIITCKVKIVIDAHNANTMKGF